MTEENTEQTNRERIARYNTEVCYECEDCGILIIGYSGDPQEAPWLYCPKCEEEMGYAVEP